MVIKGLRPRARGAFLLYSQIHSVQFCERSYPADNYVSFVKKLILEGPLKRPKLIVCPILMKFSGWGFLRVLISVMTFIFASSHH